MIKVLKNYIDKKFKPHKNDVYTVIDKLFNSLEDDLICLYMGSDITPYTDIIIKTIGKERERIKEKTGFILPAIRCQKDYNIQENEFNITVNGNKCETKFVIPTNEHIEEEIINSIYNIYQNNLSDIFPNEFVEKYKEKAKIKNFKTVTEVCYSLAAVEIKYILINLLKNNKSINNISYIFEKISEKIFIEGAYDKNNIEKISESVLNSI